MFELSRPVCPVHVSGMHNHRGAIISMLHCLSKATVQHLHIITFMIKVLSHHNYWTHCLSALVPHDIDI